MISIHRSTGKTLAAISAATPGKKPKADSELAERHESVRLRRKAEAARFLLAETAEQWNRELARSRAEIGTHEDEPPLSEAGVLRRQQLLTDVANRFERLEKEKVKRKQEEKPAPDPMEYNWQRERDMVMKFMERHPDVQSRFEEDYRENLL